MEVANLRAEISALRTELATARAIISDMAMSPLFLCPESCKCFFYILNSCLGERGNEDISKDNTKFFFKIAKNEFIKMES
jgi:hypothetical protein